MPYDCHDPLSGLCCMGQRTRRRPTAARTRSQQTGLLMDDAPPVEDVSRCQLRSSRQPAVNFALATSRRQAAQELGAASAAVCFLTRQERRATMGADNRRHRIKTLAASEDSRAAWSAFPESAARARAVHSCEMRLETASQRPKRLMAVVAPW